MLLCALSPEEARGRLSHRGHVIHLIGALGVSVGGPAFILALRDSHTDHETSPLTYSYKLPKIRGGSQSVSTLPWPKHVQNALTHALHGSVAHWGLALPLQYVMLLPLDIV